MIRLLVFLAVLLGGCAAAPSTPSPFHFPDPRVFALFTPDLSRRGTCVVIGPHLVATAGHVAADFSPMKIDDEGNWYAPVGMTFKVYDDHYVAIMATPRTFTSWFEQGTMVPGPATCYTPEGKGWGVIGWMPTPWPDAYMHGYLAVPGDSGSPVLQNDKVVGVIWGGSAVATAVGVWR